MENIDSRHPLPAARGARGRKADIYMYCMMYHKDLDVTVFGAWNYLQFDGLQGRKPRGRLVSISKMDIVTGAEDQTSGQ